MDHWNFARQKIERFDFYGCMGQINIEAFRQSRAVNIKLSLDESTIVSVTNKDGNFSATVNVNPTCRLHFTVFQLYDQLLLVHWTERTIPQLPNLKHKAKLKKKMKRGSPWTSLLYYPPPQPFFRFWIFQRHAFELGQHVKCIMR